MSMTWGQLGNNIMTWAKQKRIPISGAFELTPRCNLKCKMCYICRPSNDKQAMSLEHSAQEWIHIAREAKKAGLLYLLLTGGEIFLRHDFKEIYEEIATMGFNIQLYTNATMITPQIAKWLGRIPPSKVSITLYGASSETYGAVCDRPEAYEYAIRGIDLLHDEGITLELKTTVVKGNAGDFDKIAEFSEKRGINVGIVNYIAPRREEHFSSPETERLSPQELVEYEIYTRSYYEKKNLKNPYFPTNDDKETTLLQNTDEAFNCTAGKCAFWISWDGKMTPCGLITEPVTFPFKKGFSQSWEELKELCASLPVCITCKNCEYKKSCMTCPARLISETGAFDKPAPYLCRAAEIRSKISAENFGKEVG